MDMAPIEGGNKEGMEAILTGAGETIKYLPNEPPKKGVWFVFAYDQGAYPIGLHETEIEALRQVEREGYGHAVFWEFGKPWSEVDHK